MISTANIPNLPYQPGEPWPYYPNTWPYPSYYPTKDPVDPFVEFKKLYRKLIVETMSERLATAINDHYKDKIDKPVREDLIQWIEGEAIDIINDEPRP